MKANARINNDNYHKRKKEEEARKTVKPATKSKRQQQKEWAEILRKCEEAGLSYGEAVAKGVI